MNYLTLRKISIKILARVREADYHNPESVPQAKINEARDTFITALETFAECLPKQTKRIQIVNGVENSRILTNPQNSFYNNRVNILSFSAKVNDCCKNIEEQEEIIRMQEKILKLQEKLKELKDLLFILDPIEDAEEIAITEQKIEIVNNEITTLQKNIENLINNKDSVDYPFGILHLKTVQKNPSYYGEYLIQTMYTERFQGIDCYAWCQRSDRELMKIGYFDGYLELVGRFKEFNYLDSATLDKELDLDFKFIEPLISIASYDYAKRFLKKDVIEFLKVFKDEAIDQLYKLNVGYNN